MKYKDKYLKYKNKYLNLKKQYGGVIKKTSNEDIINAGYNITDNDILNTMKENNTLDVSTFLNNNKYFEKSGNLDNSFTISEFNKMKDFFDHLWKNTNQSFIDSNTKKFADNLFSLNGDYKYPTTISRLADSNELNNCNGFTWKFKNSQDKYDTKLIKFIEIIEESDEYKLFNSEDTIDEVKDNLINILLLINKNFINDAGNYLKTKCTEFTTNAPLSNLDDPEIFKNAMKNDDSDIFNIAENIFIIKSKKLLHIYGKTMIISEFKIDDNKIKYLKLKPYITQINVNEQYDKILKKLFNVIANKINKYLNYTIIKVSPFSFYHIHIVKVKDEHKILLVLHAAYEDQIAENFTYKGNNFNKMEYNDFRRNHMRHHNHILLIDLDNITDMSLYSIKETNLNKINNENKMFSFTISDEFGYLVYDLFGDVIGNLSYFNDKNNPMSINLYKLKPITYKKIIWEQKASIYEYIIGKMLVLLNFEKLLEGPNGDYFIKNQFSQTSHFDISGNDILNTHTIEKIKEFHKEDDEILCVYNEIEKLELDYLKCQNCILDNIKCGHMIMSYFLYDPMEIEEKNEIRELYGGKL